MVTFRQHHPRHTQPFSRLLSCDIKDHDGVGLFPTLEYRNTIYLPKWGQELASGTKFMVAHMPNTHLMPTWFFRWVMRYPQRLPFGDPSNAWPSAESILKVSPGQSETEFFLTALRAR